MPEPPTPRRGEELDWDHPLADADIEGGDCIADIPAGVLEAVAAWHDHAEPPTTEVDPRELV